MSGAFLTHCELDGVPSAADWHQWLRDGRGPPSDLAVGDWLRSSCFEDMHALRELGFDQLGVTLEWAVLEPAMGRHNMASVEHFRSLLDGAADLGFEITACLVDTSLPGWFSVDERGFTDDHARSLLWPHHVEWVGETFGDRVSSWIPIREPVHHAVRSNLLALSPPGRTNAEDTGKAVKAMLLAEGEAWRVLRGSAPVATYQTARLFLPNTNNVKAERHAAELEQLHHRSWATALAEGVLQLPDLPAVDAPALRDAFDVVVLQLRPAVAVDGDGNWSPTDIEFLTEGLATALNDQADSIGHRELQLAVDLAPVPDDGTAQLDHLGTLRSEAEGQGVKQWWQTSPIDGWHWHQGHAKPGVLSANREARAVAELFAP